MATSRLHAAGTHTPRRFPWVTWRELETYNDSIACFAWTLFLIVVCLFVTYGPRRTVTPNYFGGAQAWIQGQELYNSEGTGFIYLPQAAMVFLPFAMFPLAVGDILWRCFCIGLYAWGVRRLTSLAETSLSVPIVALTSALVMPIAWASAQNGQSTLPMAGLMMLSVGYLTTKSWCRAAACLVLAVAIKPLAIVLVLLAVALYRPMIPRLLACLAIAAVVPFLTQNPAYVWSQYVAFTQTAELATEHSNIVYFAQVFGLLRVAGWEFSPMTQTAVRAIFAGLTLLVCWWSQKRMDADRWGVYFYTLAACYLALFNPRTENNTYSLLAPALGLYLARAVLAEQSWSRAVVFSTVFVGVAGSFTIGRALTSHAQAIWPAPMAGILFTVWVLRDLVREKQPLDESSDEPLVLLPLRKSA